MASMKAEKPVGSELFGQAKKETAAKINDSGSKAPTSKAAPKKSTQKAAQGSKRKGKASKQSGK
ncbi:hypothetical protein NMG60_11036085 [Bertholletia excelsa]